MNQDTIWMIIRYALLFGGGLVVGRGWITNAQLELVIGAATAIFPAVWGVYVKWNTTPVKDTVIIANNIPSVNSATGTAEPATGPATRRKS